MKFNIFLEIEILRVISARFKRWNGYLREAALVQVHKERKIVPKRTSESRYDVKVQRFILKQDAENNRVLWQRL